MCNRIDWIFFDCMETLVDMTELPTARDYAAWAYYGSGVEELFGSFEAFYELYDKAKKTIESALENDCEYEFSKRLQMAVQLAADKSFNEFEHAKQLLYNNYWKNYSTRCYVRKDVMETLPLLKKKFKLGVVSNFMVSGGIEELLKSSGIRDCFDFVVTSIREGWRKPHVNIYETALKLSGSSYDKIMFVGDDYVNDHAAPEKLGMTTALLDRSDRHKDIKGRISDFYELKNILEGM